MKSFRHWLQEKWMEHKEECYEWHSIPEVDLAEYFQKYKWWQSTNINFVR